MIHGWLAVIAMLAVVSLSVVALMALLLYGSMALGWGLHHYPRSAALVAGLLVIGVFMAALTFNRVFPNCNFHWGMFGGSCSPVHPSQ
ncbi:MAG TPA: hypothetical protein VHX92_08630 [Rhizomicrobium sp.]|jgi:hypothetical protein|nr:hypothetical protein [Rhizomicrobium sp.]